MVNGFPKVQNFYSFKSASESCSLFEVKKEIIVRFYNLLNKLESQAQTILCTRGDSKEDIVEHDNFFKNRLNEVFVVGGKSNYHLHTEVESIYEHTYIDNKNDLLNELSELIKKANKAMNIREEEFSMKTLEYFTDLELDKFDIESLLKLKIFFLSFFHTDGRLRDFSSKSPFLSMAYGSKKYSIARKFALGKDNRKEKGFIYLYSLNAGNPYYTKTNILSKELNNRGAKWHHDKYHEILLINGMFPHYLLGIFEVEKNKTPRSIINPYLYELLENNRQFDYVNGMKIDQKNFMEYAQDLGYKSYIFSKDDGETIISQFDKSCPKKIVTSP